MNLICKVLGHKWRKGWAGAMGGPFGAIVVNLKTCERCDKCEKEYSTHIEIMEVGA